MNGNGQLLLEVRPVARLAWTWLIRWKKYLNSGWPWSSSLVVLKSFSLTVDLSHENSYHVKCKIDRVSTSQDDLTNPGRMSSASFVAEGADADNLPPITIKSKQIWDAQFAPNHCILREAGNQQLTAMNVDRTGRFRGSPKVKTSNATAHHQPHRSRPLFNTVSNRCTLVKWSRSRSRPQ